MKKPSFYKGTIISFIIMLAWSAISLPITAMYASQYPPQHGENAIHEWVYYNFSSAIIIVVIVVMILFVIAGTCAVRAENKQSKWYWEHRKDAITKVKLRKVNHRKPTADDLVRPQHLDIYLYEFQVTYDGTVSTELTIRGDDPDLDMLMSKVSNTNLLRDTHIVKTQIIAVNNTTITDTKQGISIGRAILGGMVGGGVGAVIGGLSGTARSTTTPGTNTFTFLVFYDDRAPATEQVVENSERFKFLITKIEA